VVAARRDGIEVDGIAYLKNAQVLWTGLGSPDILHPPLYSILLAPLAGLAADPEWAARLASAVLGALWVWPTLWLARETTDERVAWSAGLLVACFPAAVEAGSRALSEATFGLCLAALLAALARAVNGLGMGPASLAGLLGGLSTLARPEGMSYLPLAWGVLLAAPRASRTRPSARQVAMAVLALTVVWLATVAPYAALVRKHTGHWHWSGKLGVTLVWGESVGQDRPALFIDRFLARADPSAVPTGLVAYVAERPWDVLRRLTIGLHHLDRDVAPSVLHTGGIVLLTLGLLSLRGPGPAGRRPEWLLPLALLPSAGVLLFVASPRYFAPLLPVVAVIAGIGLARLGRAGAAAEAPRRRLLARGLLALAVLSFVPWIVRPWFRPDAAGVEKAAGVWLLREAGPGAVYVGRHPRVAYYARAREVPLADRPLDAVLAEGRRVGARFLIVDNVHLPALRPDLLPLTGGDPARYAGDLALAHIAEDRAGNSVVIYRILSPAGAGGARSEARDVLTGPSQRRGSARGTRPKDGSRQMGLFRQPATSDAGSAS
jgi:4-amino-4-deoxy-L-arabinose transferase-like glycosyltransferase